MCPEREIIVSGILLHTPCVRLFVYVCLLSGAFSYTTVWYACVRTTERHCIFMIWIQSGWSHQGLHRLYCSTGVAVWLCSCDAPETNVDTDLTRCSWPLGRIWDSQHLNENKHILSEHMLWMEGVVIIRKKAAVFKKRCSVEQKCTQKEWRPNLIGCFHEPTLSPL